MRTREARARVQGKSGKRKAVKTEKRRNGKERNNRVEEVEGISTQRLLDVVQTSISTHVQHSLI